MMIVTYLLLYPVAVYIFFPTFWHNPFSEFTEAVTWMSYFPLDVKTFFMGVTVHSLDTPWYYALVWMGITIPLAWWLFFCVGIIAAIILLLKERGISFLHWLLMLLWFGIPLGVAIVLHSAMYDDARHLFFIYPSFILIMVLGIRFLLQKKIFQKKLQLIVRASTSVILLTTTIYVAIFMIRFHPYQYVYFNLIGRKYATDYFEKDYWGLSYRSAMEFLVQYDKSKSINVSWQVDPGEWNLAWLNNYDRQRLHLNRKPGQYDYFITGFRRQHPADASDQKIFEVKVQGITIMAVYKMHPLNAAHTSSP